MPLDVIYTGHGWCSNIFLTRSQRPDIVNINQKMIYVSAKSRIQTFSTNTELPQTCSIYHTAIITGTMTQMGCSLYWHLFHTGSEL